MKSNSKTVALVEFIVIPAASNVFSKSVSPVQAALPSFNCEVLGPGALDTFPVLKITPLVRGNAVFVLVK